MSFASLQKWKPRQVSLWATDGFFILLFSFLIIRDRFFDVEWANMEVWCRTREELYGIADVQEYLSEVLYDRGTPQQP